MTCASWPADALRRNQHFGAIAASAQAKAADTSWKNGCEPEVVSTKTLFGVGVPVDAARGIRRKAPEISAPETAMSVKAGTGVCMLLEVYRVQRGAGGQARVVRDDWKEATKFLWRPDFRPRLAEWWRTSRWPARPARGAGVRVAHGAVPAVLPGARAIRKHAPFLGLSEQSWVELVGGSAPPLRQELLRRGMSRQEVLCACSQRRGLRCEEIQSRIPIERNSPLLIASVMNL